MASRPIFLPQSLGRFHWMLVPLGLSLLVLMLWLPWGFSSGGWGDEWVVMAKLSAGNFIISPDRPFISLPWLIAYSLTPDSFVGLNLVLAAAFLCKGIVFYGLVVRLLPENRVLAFAGAALLIVYPADFAYYNLGAVGIHVAVCAYLAAVYLLVVYWQRPRIITLLGMWAALTIAVGSYEVVYPLVAFTPLLLLTMERGLSRRLLGVTILWYILPALFVLSFIVSQLGGNNTGGYQSALIADDNSIPAMLLSLVKAYGWHLLTAWPRTIPFSPQRLDDTFALLAGGAAVLSAFLMWALSYTPSAVTNVRRYGLLAIGGLVALGLGFIAYLPSVLRAAFGRTTFYSTPGAVICVVVVLWALTRLSERWRRVIGVGLATIAIVLVGASSPPAPFTMLMIIVGAAGFWMKGSLPYPFVMAALIGIGTAYHLDQHRTYHQYAANQQPFLQTLVEQTRGLQAGSVVLIFAPPDENELYENFLWRGDLPDAALQYILNQPDVNAFICYPQNTQQPTASQCELRPNGVDVHVESLPPDFGGLRQFTYDRVVAFRYDLEGNMVLLDRLPVADPQGTITADYQPEKRLDSNMPLPPRLMTVFGARTAENTQP